MLDSLFSKDFTKCRSGLIFLKNLGVINGQSSGHANRLQDTLHGVDAIFQPSVVSVRSLQHSPDPTDQAILTSLQPIDGFSDPIARFNLALFDDVGGRKEDVATPARD